MHMWVNLIFPADLEWDDKELLLDEMELNALMNSQKVGSEGRYFDIEGKIFEDIKNEDGSIEYRVTILLK